MILAGLVYVASLFTSIRVVYEGDAPLWSRLVYYPSCVMACVCFNNLCRCLAKWPFPIMSYVGRNAMHYYVAHFVVLYVTLNVVKMYKETWYAGWQGLLFVLFAYAIFLTLYSYLFNLLHDSTLRRQPYNCG